MTRPLVKYGSYTRKEVRDIFSPQTEYVPGAGSWGLKGLIRIPERPNDFVFFVTYGRRQGDHTFDESITEDGILTWQSQPRQKLSSPTMQQLINHNHLQNNIYLFLRTSSKNLTYTYLGRLAYVEHDSEREQPVYFKWQILDWELSPEKAREMELQLIESSVDDFCLPEEVASTISFPEGAKRQITVNAYERNAEARRKCIDHYGARCVICGFDFAQKYGAVGAGFIHVHHIMPLSSLEDGYSVNPVVDLRPVCPNCHAIIHKRKPPYQIEEIRRFITEAKALPDGGYVKRDV